MDNGARSPRRWFEALLYRGVLGSVPEDIHRVALVNAIALGASITLLCWAVLQIAAESHVIAAISFFGALWFAATFAFQRRGASYQTALMASLGGVLIISAELVLSVSHDGGHLYILVVAMVPLVAFPLRYSKSALLLSLLALASYIYWSLQIDAQVWLPGFTAVDHSRSLVRDVSLVALLALVGYQTRRVATIARESIEAERSITDKLIHSFLPDSVADALKQGQRHVVQRHADVTLIIAQIDGFDHLCNQQWPGMVTQIVTDIHDRFDKACKECGAIRVKATGSTYVAAVGLEIPTADHAESAASLALAMNLGAATYSARRGGTLWVRVGLDSGPILAGTVGRQRISYDLWGDTFDRALDLCRTSEPGRIQISALAHAKISYNFQCEPVDASHEHASSAYWLLGQRSSTKPLSQLLESRG